MLKFKKIAKTIAIFVVIMISICFVISIINVLNNQIQPEEIISKTGLYFLYTIGYGALEGDAVLQNLLAMIGIVALALMTTYLTINLFWRLDDVKLNKEMQYDGRYLKLQFKNYGTPICDVKVTFILYDDKTAENIEEPKEYYMPILLKNSFWNLKLDINETFWYKAIYNLLVEENRKLYCIFSFVDTQNGQSSIKVEEIQKENLKMNNKLLEYEEFIKPIKISCERLNPIENNGKIHLNYDEGNMNIQYNFPKNRNSESFIMAYYNFHDTTLNLEKYNKETTYLEFAVQANNNMLLTMEIKTKNNNVISRKIEVNEELQNIKIEFKDICDNLEEINEICYTIFAKENANENSFNISDLKIFTK